MENTQTNYFVCIGVNTWGSATTEKEAMTNAHIYSKQTPHGIYRFTHNDFLIDPVDGSLNYKGEAPTIVRKVMRKK